MQTYGLDDNLNHFVKRRSRSNHDIDHLINPKKTFESKKCQADTMTEEIDDKQNIINQLQMDNKIIKLENVIKIKKSRFEMSTIIKNYEK